MTMKEEIKACLIASLETGLDPYMSDNGFSRVKSGLIYLRKINGSTQKLHVAMRIHPKDNPNAAAAVYPEFEVFVPDVDAMLDEMIGDNLGLLEGITGGTSRQPIGLTSQKADPGRWFIYQPDSVPEVVNKIKVFIERWTMSLLNSYTTAQDILEADERDDQRLARDRAQAMRVVAAALVCDRKSYAQARMEKWLGQMVTRRRYAQVYDYISNYARDAGSAAR